jgi:transcription elongation GreA/GreB family factor
MNTKLQERINKVLEIPEDVRMSFEHTDEGKVLTYLLVGYQEIDLARVDESDIDAVIDAVKLMSIYKLL